MKRIQYLLFLLVIVSVVFSFAACRKKEPPAPIEPVTPSVEVPEKPPSEPPPPEVKQIQEGEITDEIIAEITRQMKPVFYDFDKSDIREDQIASLQNNARVLKQYPSASVLIEGHCDERGTDEYNLALGERRARTSKDYLVSLGIAENRMSTISYGESRPFAPGHNEDAWQQNRRAHFIAVKK